MSVSHLFTLVALAVTALLPRANAETADHGARAAEVNAPAALGCFRLARFLKGEEAEYWNKLGEKITIWTVKTLQGSNDLFGDAIVVTTGEVNHGQLTYNSGVMLRVFLACHARTGQQGQGPPDG